MIRKAALKVCVPDSTIHHLPFMVTPDMVEDALIAADHMGRRYESDLQAEVRDGVFLACTAGHGDGMKRDPTWCVRKKTAAFP